MADTATTSKVTPQSLCDNHSLEITAKEYEKLIDAAPVIRPGTHISVTFLPGEDFDMRVKTAAKVKELGFLPCPHFSARRLASEAELENYLARLRDEVAFDHAFVIAGDPPQPMGPYEDAMAIISSGILAKYGVKYIGISGYPEGHPDIPTPKLWQAMRDKVAYLKDNGYDFEIMTQFAFDYEAMLTWVEQVRNEGIDAPIRLGVPGPTSVKRLLSFAARCGVGASASVMKKYGFSITQLLTTAGPDKLVTNLADGLDPARHGTVRLHFYPFGALRATGEWIENFCGK